MSLCYAEQDSAGIEVFNIWPDGNPGGWVEKREEDITVRNGVTRIQKINTPTLKHYSPLPGASKKKKAVIVCPGGGYNILAYDKEGEEIAEWLSRNGYHAFVLKYRLPRKGVDKIRYKAALQDAQRALSIVNTRKKELGVEKTGIMGFSAGAHLSAVAACNFKDRAYAPVDAVDKSSCRPDFLILIYPAYLLSDFRTYKRAKEVTVPSDMPPVFLLQTEDDCIHVENSLFFYAALKKKNISAEMHIYAEGGHGYGMRKRDLPVDVWPELLLEWLKCQ